VLGCPDKADASQAAWCADEITDAIVFAIKNDFINGKVIEIDGGLRL